MSELDDAAEDYLKAHPFTMAGFHKAEVDLIQGAYRDAYLAGAERQRERYEQGIAKLQVEIDKLVAELSAIAGLTKQKCSPMPCSKTYRCDQHAGGSQHVNAQSNQDPIATPAPLICARHPIMRDEACGTCWEAKDRNDVVREERCKCGHPKKAHIYHEGACRPGFECQMGCGKYEHEERTDE